MPWNAKQHMHHILIKMTDVIHMHTKHKRQQLILLYLLKNDSQLNQNILQQVLLISYARK